MTDRETIIAYIEAKAAQHRARGNEGTRGWAVARRDARTLLILADDLRAGLDQAREEAA